MQITLRHSLGQFSEGIAMRESRTLSSTEWYVLSGKRAELGEWLDRIRVELDTSAGSDALLARFEKLSKEFHEIEVLMAN